MGWPAPIALIFGSKPCLRWHLTVPGPSYIIRAANHVCTAANAKDGSTTGASHQNDSLAGPIPRRLLFLIPLISTLVQCAGEGGNLETCIEVYWSSHLPDGRALDLLAQIERLGLNSIHQVRVSDLYFLHGALSASEVERLAAELLVDPIVEGVCLRSAAGSPAVEGAERVVEVGYHPGVTDPVADNLLRRAHLLGLEGLQAAATGRRYTFEGAPSEADLHTVARQLLCNDIIQSYTLGPMRPTFAPQAESSTVMEVVPLRDLSD